MKKINLIIISLIIMGVLVAGCSNKNEKNNNNNNVISYTLTEMLDKIIEEAKKYDTDKEYGISALPNNHVNIDLENIEDNLGITKEEYNKYIEEYIESKPEEAYYTHSIILVKIKNGEDVKTIAEKLTKGVSPYRFSSVKPDVIIGAYSGSYVMVVSSSKETASAVYTSFQNIVGTSSKIERTNDWDTSLFE